MKFLQTTTTLATAVILAAAVHVRAQGTEDLLTTLGTTVKSPVDGKIHAYLLWQPGDAAVTFGKRYAIHSKSGDADSTAPFTRHGIQTLQTSRNTVRAMLELGAKIDRDAAAAPGRIGALYQQLIYDGDHPPPPADPSLDAAGKLLFIMQSAVTDAETLSRLFFLGRAHPGVMMALGHGFSIPVTAGERTFEIREVDAADNDFRVVGRITLDTDNPVIPAAPTAPFAVSHPVAPASYHTVNPKDHLNVRLRWGADESLRDQMPHTFGFDIYRVKKDVAESLGWDATPPSRQAMLSALDATNPSDPAPDIARANTLPVLIGDLLTPAEASDPADTERIDFSDDGVWHLDANGDPARRAYQDGEAFYFYAAARGITGLPGEISPGALVVMCDTMPPQPPTIESVTSQFTPPDTDVEWEEQGGDQHLQVKFRQLPESPESAAATGYYIYRWSRSQEYLDNIGNPVIGRVAYVAHDPGETFGTFDDNGAGAPTLDTHSDRSVWYTVRSVGVSACPEPVLSGHSSPLPGFLRDLKAPDFASGDILICRQLPSAEFKGRQDAHPQELKLPEDYTGFSILADRKNPAIVAADVRVLSTGRGQESLILHAERHVFQRGDRIQVNIPYQQPGEDSLTNVYIGVRAVTTHGQVSDFAGAMVMDAKESGFGVYNFELNARKDCQPISEVTDAVPVHEAFDADGSVNPIQGVINFDIDQGVREWRVYRRVGPEGALGLIAKNEGDSLTSPAPWVDDSPPAAAGMRVCYFVQVLDQNANPSPLFPVACVTMLNPDLPTPMLAPAEAAIGANDDRMAVNLEWFCDPVGVERFEILIARQGGGGVPEVEGLSAPLSSDVVTGLYPDFPDLRFYRYQSQRIGGVIGNGPSYTTEIELPADATYFFAIRACGPGEPGARAVGSASNVANARWVVEADTSQPIIPWPARPLPGRHDHRLSIGLYTQGEGPIWPIVLPSDYRVPTSFLVGVTRHNVNTVFDDKTRESISQLYSPEPPENYLFQMRRETGDPASLEDLMPFMLFRYQLPSDRFPDARANLIQCTPRIDRVSWHRGEDEKGGKYYELRDPWFRLLNVRESGIPVPVSGGWSDENPPNVAAPSNLTSLPPYLEDMTGLLLLADPLPVTLGARYRYLITQFDERGEINRVIPIDPIQH